MNAILVMWSGGLDSTYCVWKAFQQKCYVHLHHINFINSDMRFQAEKRAIENMKRYFRREGFSYMYNETTIDTSQLHNFGFDEDWVLFIAAKVLLDIPADHITIYDGLIKDDLNNQSLLDRHEKRCSMKEFLNICAWYRQGKEIDIQFPAKNKTKEDIWKEMPDELRNLTFSCRRPYQGIACGKCKTCIQIKHLKGDSK